MASIEALKNERLKSGYTANLIWAGLPGLIALLSPRLAEKLIWRPLLGKRQQDPMVTQMLGSVWLSIGLVSLLGLRRPQAYVGLFPMQIAYKALWLGFAAAPKMVRGEKSSLPMAVGFGGVIAALWALIPVREILKDQEQARDKAFGRAVVADRVSTLWSPQSL